jgi:type IV secretion system protein VirB2
VTRTPKTAPRSAPKTNKLIGVLLALTLALVATPAFAQIAKVNSVLETVRSILLGVSVVLFTISFIWVGYKMAFQHAKWSEVSNILIGGIFVGGASAIAAMIVG